MNYGKKECDIEIFSDKAKDKIYTCGRIYYGKMNSSNLHFLIFLYN